jgi:hypothetical protein
MTINDNFIQTSVANQGVVSVSGITNPSLPGQYLFRYYLNSAILNWGSVTFSMASTIISTVSITPLAKQNNALMSFYAAFVTPAYIYDGYFTWDEPVKPYGRIDITLNLENGAGILWFLYDLGTGIQDDYISCNTIGLVASSFSPTTNCVLVSGPSSAPSATDVVTFRVINFGPVLPGTSLGVNFPGFSCQRNKIQLLINII